MKVKASKIDDIAFEIGRKYDGIIWVLRDGELYLAHRDLYFKSGERWYSLPISALESISVVSETPLKIKFSLPSVNVIVHGKNASRLLALRHLLLPYLQDKSAREVKTVLKLWYLGVKTADGLAVIMECSTEAIKGIIEKAKAMEYIDENNNITEKGMSVFTKEEISLLEEVKHG